MVKRFLTSEEGFSLSEMLIVLMLMGMIIAVTYASLGAVQTSARVSDRQAVYALEIGTPLLDIEEILQQAKVIEAASAYSITVLTDQDNVGTDERHVIAASTDGRLTRQAWNTTSAGVNSTMRIDAEWSIHNANRDVTQPRPLFTYFDEDGVQIEDMTLVAANAKTIEVLIVAKVDDRTVQGSRTVRLRNR